jgi:hydroxysqualene dehydroxylase
MSDPKAGALNGRKIAVIGGGWAGLAAAVRARKRGAQVSLFEASQELGGRARTVIWRAADSVQIPIDNGQHLLLGAYRETLGLIEELAPNQALFYRQPLRLLSPGFLDSSAHHNHPNPVAAIALQAKRLPAPLHLLAGMIGAKGISLTDRWAMSRWMLALRLRGWRAAPGLTVAQALSLGKQPASLIQQIWAPLCIAALNTPIETACASVFLNVLRDSLGSNAQASDFVIARAQLGSTLPANAAIWFKAQGVSVHLGEAIQSIESTDPKAPLTIHSKLATQYFDGVIVACAARHAQQMLTTHHPHTSSSLDEWFALPQLPICTIYLRWHPGITSTSANQTSAASQVLPNGPWMLRSGFAQWLFDLGERPSVGRLVSCVISADGPHLSLTREALGDAVAQQVCTQMGWPLPTEHFVMTEKRATFACTPGIKRAPVDLLTAIHPALFLAGDYTESPYPATLEAAVRSGLRAAQQLK